MPMDFVEYNILSRVYTDWRHAKGVRGSITMCAGIGVVCLYASYYTLYCANDWSSVSTLMVFFYFRLGDLISSIYSIVKDSSADLGVNSKIVQIRPTVKAVCTKISKNFFCIFVNIFIFLRENKEIAFFYFEYLS